MRRRTPLLFTAFVMAVTACGGNVTGPDYAPALNAGDPEDADCVDTGEDPPPSCYEVIIEI